MWKIFKKSLFIFVFLLCSIEIIAGEKILQPIAQNGFLDISKWSFENNGAVNLDGDWEFYWNEFLLSKNEKFNLENKHYATVPKNWLSVEKDGKPLPGLGYATYRLIVKLPSDVTNFAIKGNNIETAYEIFLNGKSVGKNGRIGKTETESLPDWNVGFYQFPKDTETIEIIVQLSNFHHARGGFSFSFQLGEFNQMRDLREKALFIDFVLFGALMIMSIYHFTIFYLRRHELSALYFAFLCLCISVRILCTGETSVKIFLPELSFELHAKLIYGFLYLAGIFFTMYLRSLFLNEYPKRAYYAHLFAFIPLVLIAMFTKPLFFTKTLDFFYLVTFSSFIFSVYSIVLGIIRKKEGIYSLVLGFLLLVVTYINDILYNKNIVNTGSYAPSGLLGFVFSQAFLLSKKFSKEFIRTDALTKRLQVSNEELLRVKDELNKINFGLEELILARTNQLYSKQTILEKELDMARDLQRLLLPKDLPQWTNFKLNAEYIPMDKVGGDFYDLIPLENGKWGIFVCDVSGHGVPAAFIASMVKMSLEQKLKSFTKPSELLTHINHLLIGKIGKNFVTAFYSIFDPSSGTLEYSNAGHIYPIYLSSDGKNNELEFKGMLLGLKEDAEFENYKMKLSEKERFVIYTDGITETKNRHFDLYGEERLLNFLQSSMEKNGKDVIFSLLDNVKRFSRKRKFDDDITIVILDGSNQN